MITPNTDQNNNCDENCTVLSELELLRRYMTTILDPNRDSILIPQNSENLKKQEPKFDHSNKRLVLGKKSYYFNEEGHAIVPPKSPVSPILDYSSNNDSQDVILQAINVLKNVSNQDVK